MRSILSVTVMIMVWALTSGCGVGYTLIKSEAKLDRLAVPMTKAQVLDHIGHPDRVLKLAVKGMLPKGRLGYAMIKKLKIYAGSEHPHSAQQPKALEI